MKRVAVIDDHFVSRIVPNAGAWIETYVVILIGRFGAVAPHVEAWLETVER